MKSSCLAVVASCAALLLCACPSGTHTWPPAGRAVTDAGR
jgi:hypothetical protein